MRSTLRRLLRESGVPNPDCCAGPHSPVRSKEIKNDEDHSEEAGCRALGRPESGHVAAAGGQTLLTCSDLCTQRACTDTNGRFCDLDTLFIHGCAGGEY
jgi:hypothetical protein